MFHGLINQNGIVLAIGTEEFINNYMKDRSLENVVRFKSNDDGSTITSTGCFELQKMHLNSIRSRISEINGSILNFLQMKRIEIKSIKN